MKLSFSTKGWHGYLWEDFCKIATEQGFNGIELHNVNNPSFTEKNGAFYMSSAQATVRELYEKNLRIPCIDTLKNPASKEDRDAFSEELNKCLEIASTLHIPFVRIKATDTGASFEEQKAEVVSVLSVLLLCHSWEKIRYQQWLSGGNPVPGKRESPASEEGMLHRKTDSRWIGPRGQAAAIRSHHNNAVCAH